MIKWLKNNSLLADGAVFKHWRLVPESVVLTGQGRILLHNWKGLLMQWLRYKKVSLPVGEVYVSVHNSYRGYYHWLLESVPKLLETKRDVAEFTLLLPDSCTEAFYSDILRLLNVMRVERLAPNTVYQVQSLALPYMAESMGDYHAQTLHNVRNTLLQAAGITPAVANKRVYISRRKAARRKVLNEVEVEQLLACYGFESVCFEDLTFEEQLRLCASTQILVGIHGAGLSNIIFLPEAASVVEFRKFDNGANYFFTKLAATLGYHSHLLYCAADDETRSVQDADLYVDLAKLEAVLHELDA